MATTLQNMNRYSKFLVLFALPFVLMGCSNDDDDPVVEDNLLGKWELISSMDDDYWEKPCIFNFHEGTRLTITFAEGKSYEETVLCKYKTTGSYLYIDFGNGDEIYEGTYKISKNTLTFDMVSYSPDDPSDVYEDFLTLKRIK